ncbi:MAG: putative cytosolic protein [Desulfotomaculum sp. 46_80]|nr:MAG: putative cytosolic protein [Desulfotomaculum sp. 46_80]
MRVRGLKHSQWHYQPPPLDVAPRAGAWIETQNRLLYAWLLSSHPVRVRGLKRLMDHMASHPYKVAPRAGAWIETANIGAKGLDEQRSHPVRVRGLKLLIE